MTVVEALKIPLIEKQRVPVAQIVRQLEATGKDKRLLESHIKEMKLVSALDENTIRIRPFNDDEHLFNVIYVFEVELKINDQHRELSELIHSVFPEPVLINYIYSDKNYLSVAEKRISKKDNSKMVIKDIYESEIATVDDYELLDFSIFKANNLKDYYGNIVTLINQLRVKSIIGILPKEDIDFKGTVKEYESLTTQISKLQEDYNKETMMSKKMRIDDQMFNKEKELKSLIRRIRRNI